MIQGARGGVKLIGMFGSESLGKTSTGYMLTGRLRTHGLLAEFVTDSSGAMPFPPYRFDTHETAWMHVISKKIQRECAYALRTNVDTIVSDRTPLDLLAYFQYKHPESALRAACVPLVMEWMKQYDLLFFLPAEGTAYRYEQFREPGSESRDFIDGYFHERLDALRQSLPSIHVASGSYRERSEFMYHTTLAVLTGKEKSKQVVGQLTEYFGSTAYPVSEVRLLGSRSITRGHLASDEDDYDLLVVVDAPAAAAEAWDRKLDRKYLESMCEASLDIKIVSKDTLPHEV